MARRFLTPANSIQGDKQMSTSDGKPPRRRLPPRQASGPDWTTDRRSFLRLTGAAGLLGAVGAAGAATGCSSGTSTTSQSAPGGGTQIHEYVPGPQPGSGGRKGGTVGVVWSDPPNSFDPAIGYNLTAWDAITQLVYFNGLMAYDKQVGGPVPNIAAAPPALSADSKTLTFKLRPGVKFHN